MEEVLNEVRYTTSRSSGPGGQHVNKTESKVTLIWNLEESKAIPEEQKRLLRKRLRKRISERGELLLSCQNHRSQQQNKDEVTGRFLALIRKMSRPPKKRIRTRPTKTSMEKRLKDKKIRAEKKRYRGRPDPE